MRYEDIQLVENQSNDELLEVLKERGIDARPITDFSDTELNNEISRRRHLVEQQYEAMMGQRLV